MAFSHKENRPEEIGTEGNGKQMTWWKAISGNLLRLQTGTFS